jgi:large subunit ribosomal protein L19
VTRAGKVRRSKLYFLRDRTGKQTRVQELLGEKARREREFEKAMRASIADDEVTSGEGADEAPAAAGASKPVKV